MRRSSCPISCKRVVLRARTARGFTLYEMVAVVVILAILAVIATPRFAATGARQRVDAAARRVATDLTLARRIARTSSKSQSVVFRPPQGSYELEGVDDMDHLDRAYVVYLARSPYEATLRSADFDGKLQLNFDGYGTPDTGGTVVVEVGQFSRSVAVDAETGEASVE